MSKLICVVGATGNQGGSLVADAPGIEVVAADLDDVATLESAFKGAHVIFSVTNYWEPFMRPDYRAKASEQGITCRRIAYDVEYRQGKNIADAAATTADTLEVFLVSTLSHAGKATGGKITELYHFDAKADIFPLYLEENYNILPESYFKKNADGSFKMRFTTNAPGKAYMAAGTFCSWREWIETWGKIVGVDASYEQVSQEELIASAFDRDLGIEVTHMFDYTSEPGYDGGYDLLTAKDLVENGIECPMTSWEDWAKKNDWTTVLSK
ncbi:unnamed protein product [Parascedosporium putredinis]|uniref:NmrA-like domain-containing protein n=1 Tax=Parascedosporium putredinis TaxID=1442378 RepID=A0A9P1H5V0_9PEZI|nr:unnamed protein product [Parascedosporium putredinis]CAI7996783.1 unnamed protein product [Parascedosporium putredinis]